MVATGSRRAKGVAGAILTAVTVIAVAPATASAPAKPRCLDHEVVAALRATHDSVFAIRCADLTGEGVRDVAYMKIADGARPAGTIIEWGVVYSTGAGIRTARFSGQRGYRNLRIRGRRVLIDSPVVRPAEPISHPTRALLRTEEARWNGTRFVRRLVGFQLRAPR